MDVPTENAKNVVIAFQRRRFWHKRGLLTTALRPHA